MARLPWMDPDNFNPGYLMRSMHLLPKRGDKPEWQHSQDYWREKDELPLIDLDEAAFVDLAEILYGQAVLAEGGQLEDPAGFVKRLNKLILGQTGTSKILLG